MKLKRFIAYASAVFGIVLCGCANDNGTIDTITLKAGFSTGASDPRVIATEMFKEEVEKNTDGRITIEIYPDSELGADSELIDGIVNSTVDITASSAGNFANYDPNVGISAFPFLFNSFEDAWFFVDGEVEERAEANLGECNIKVLAHYDNGFRCITTSESYGPIEKVSDMDGLNIRVPENQIVTQTMLLLGAQPRTLPFNELYAALESGEFEAQENPIPVIYNSKLYEVQKNLAITNHSYDVMLFVIRKDIWDRLTKEDKAIIEKAALNAQEKNRELIKEQTEEYVFELKELGMNITNPNLYEFRKATAKSVEIFRDTYDADLLNLIR
ncbi:MAG: TRAP transporter substrate-binding protein [Lachnospiraceae bacterium]|nr:TRAP transporter substrate-binding protein [Lachnospiraceae bacterium]